MPLLISHCPSCGGTLEARKLWCAACEMAIEADFALGVLSQLAPEEQHFVTEFIKSSGSLKEMARRFGVSYPTVRNRLDELIRRVQELEKAGKANG